MPSVHAPLVETRALARRYRSGDSWIDALRDLSLEVRAGESVAVVGPSGSGKSTLLGLIGALDRPTSGTVHLDGRDLSRLRSRDLAGVRQRTVGFVFQSFRLLPHLTALENVALPALLAGSLRGEALARADALLARVGLGGRRTHRPSHLSAGEQQRVATARALVNEPRLLLADEPTGNLDAESARTLLALFDELRGERQLTLMIATHDLEIARRSDRVVALRSGRLDTVSA
ncbi:MAG: ABC transporter ATP-binding protein [Chloroflexi bacterium]|nr:ABC transporter ATP-binding protein [Chloroflexota bacterium]